MTSPEITWPWDQREKESGKAHAAFRLYLEQGVENRSIRRVAEKLEKSETLIGRWATTHDWVERVSEYDAHMLRLVQEAVETEVVEMSKRHAQVAVAFQNKVIARLQNLNAEDLTPTQLAQWFEISTRIERTARGMPDISVATLRPSDQEDEAIDHEKVVSLSDWLRNQPEDEEEADDAVDG